MNRKDVTVDLEQGDCIPMKELASAIRVQFGVRRSARTLHRYAQQGVRGQDGQLHFLESMRIGGERHSSVAAFKRFVAKCNLDESASSGSCNCE